jgi:hypothetical protein
MLTKALKIGTTIHGIIIGKWWINQRGPIAFSSVSVRGTTISIATNYEIAKFLPREWVPYALALIGLNIYNWA